MGSRRERGWRLGSCSVKAIWLMWPGHYWKRVSRWYEKAQLCTWFDDPRIKKSQTVGFDRCWIAPGRVYKGKKMPGRMGGTKTKIRKLKIEKIDNELRAIMIKGAVPGKPGNLIRFTPTKIVGKNIPKT